MLELIDIVHNYDGKRLLDGVNFSVDENEVLCLLGPSGGGKSTILRIIAGFEKPLSGKVLYNGRDITNDPVYRRDFGMVFQDYALFPHMSVYENIAFGLRMKGETGIELGKKVQASLDQVGMAGFADRKVTDLSGGEQQRVALARSLVVRPSLLMLDEPLGALDYSLRQTLIEELHEILGKNGISAIYVTHDQNEAMALSDRIAILHRGRIIQADTPEKLFAHPVDPWCANFLGFHNFIKGRIIPGGTVSFRNFTNEIRIDAAGRGLPEYGEAAILLKEGTFLSDSDVPGNTALVLDAVPQQNLYRGEYYDVRLKVDEETEITLRSKTKLPAGRVLKIACKREDLIVYGQKPQTAEI
ncbi:MAG: ABC transporter ATP-binding protein [Flexilinea sp.]|nr:ABC transporter ATP-binding protein [Flexilinea sp.]